jgi:Ca-activated chloride channel family protein
VPNLTFDNLRWLNLLWVVLAVAALGVYGLWQRRRTLRLFADLRLLERLAPRVGWLRPLVRLALVITCLTLLVGAIIGPRWGAQTQAMMRRNIDLMVLLDVSRSMLARDIAPNRLERAKLAIRDDLLPALGGDRIGIIAFAGVPSVACPLTSDYGFFRLALNDVSTQSAPRGGTLIGDAIRKAGELLNDKVDAHKVILLITDGEDHESFPVEAAAGVWKDQHIPVIAVALGDSEHGARIPVPAERGEGYLKYGDEVVWTKANFDELRKVAGVSPQGMFVAVGTSNFDLGEIYRRVASGIRYDEEAQQRLVRQPTRYHPFAVAALVLLLVESCLREAPRRPATTPSVARNASEKAA